MNSLILKRVILIFLLVASIATLSFYQFIYANDDSASIERLMNNRKHKKDYDHLFDDSLYKSFTIQFSDESFQNLLDSMQAYFDEYGTYQDNTMHKVDVVYSDGLGNSFSLQEVGFRTKSNTSRNLPLTYDWRGREIYHQTSFQLQFDATFDYPDNSNEYAVLNSREAFNVKQLNFEFCKSFDGYYDEAMISEAYSYYLYEQAGVVVSNATYGIVYFRILDTLVGFGFYTIIEPIDQQFLKKHFDSDALGDYGDLYKATDTAGDADLSMNYAGSIGINENAVNERYSYSLKNNTLDGTRQIHGPLIDLIENLNSVVYFSLHSEELIEIDGFIRALAMDFLIGNTDDYRYNYNNFYLYFNVYTSQAVYIPFDLDNSLGFGKHQDLTYQYGLNYDLFSPTDEQAVLVKRVFENESYVALYYQYLNEFATTLFTYDAFYEQFLIAKELYQDVLINENHLGNQVFDVRNIEWYIDTKRMNVLEMLENIVE